MKHRRSLLSLLLTSLLLLSVLLPVVQVVSFRELLPSVSDIFIAQVKQMQKGGGDE